MLGVARERRAVRPWSGNQMLRRHLERSVGRHLQPLTGGQDVHRDVAGRLRVQGDLPGPGEEAAQLGEVGGEVPLGPAARGAPAG